MAPEYQITQKARRKAKSSSFRTLNDNVSVAGMSLSITNKIDQDD